MAPADEAAGNTGARRGVLADSHSGMEPLINPGLVTQAEMSYLLSCRG